MKGRLSALLPPLRFVGYGRLLDAAFWYAVAAILLYLRWVNHGTATLMAASGPPPDPAHAKVYWQALENCRSNPPTWAIVVNLLFALERTWNVRRRLRQYTGESLRRVGRCGSCGYDLRASPGRCPECGAEPASPATPDRTGPGPPADGGDRAPGTLSG